MPKTARGAATRARIVDAATELVRAHGVANTTIDAVIEASKVSKSQIYHYFADKDDLVLAVIQRQAECVLGTHEELLRKLNSLAGLRRWRDAVVELTRQTNCAGGCPLGSLAAELSETPRTRAALADELCALGILFRDGVRQDAGAGGKKAEWRFEGALRGDARQPSGRAFARTNHAFDKASGVGVGHGD